MYTFYNFFISKWSAPKELVYHPQLVLPRSPAGSFLEFLFHNLRIRPDVNTKYLNQMGILIWRILKLFPNKLDILSFSASSYTLDISTRPSHFHGALNLKNQFEATGSPRSMDLLGLGLSNTERSSTYFFSVHSRRFKIAVSTLSKLESVFFWIKFSTVPLSHMFHLSANHWPVKVEGISDNE